MKPVTLFAGARIKAVCAFWLTIVLLTLSRAPSAYAAVVCTTEADIDTYGLSCIEGVFQNVLKAAISGAGLLSFIFIIRGGMKYTSAGGDMKALDSARKTLTWAVVGLVISVSGYAILSALGSQLGITDLIRFVIPSP